MAFSFWLGFSLVLTVVSVLIWEAFHATPSMFINIFGKRLEFNPIRGFIRLIDSSPILQMLFHFAIGFAIVSFVGDGLISGAANLTATCVFPIWCFLRLKYIGTKEMKDWWREREAKARARLAHR